MAKRCTSIPFNLRVLLNSAIQSKDLDFCVPHKLFKDLPDMYIIDVVSRGEMT